MGLVVRTVLQSADWVLVVLRVLLLCGSLELGGHSKLLGMGGEGRGGVLWRGSIPWAGDCWVGGIPADA